MIKKFTKKNSHSIVFTSLGQVRYYSCLKYVDAVVGNSSSGLLEAPTFKIGTIDIGDRQKGRIKAESVISCNPDQKSILSSIEIIYSKKFKDTLSVVKSPYGEGGASDAIVNVLESMPLDNMLKKEFVDLDYD